MAKWKNLVPVTVLLAIFFVRPSSQTYGHHGGQQRKFHITAKIIQLPAFSVPVGNGRPGAELGEADFNSHSGGYDPNIRQQGQNRDFSRGQDFQSSLREGHSSRQHQNGGIDQSSGNYESGHNRQHGAFNQHIGHANNEKYGQGQSGFSHGGSNDGQSKQNQKPNEQQQNYNRGEEYSSQGDFQSGGYQGGSDTGFQGFQKDQREHNSGQGKVFNVQFGAHHGTSNDVSNENRVPENQQHVFVSGPIPTHESGPQKRPTNPDQSSFSLPQMHFGFKPFPTDFPKKTPEQVPGKIPHQVPEQIPEQVSQNPEKFPVHIPEQTPEHIPDIIPAQIPERIPEQTPERTPDHFPQQHPEKYPGHQQEPTPVPERQPGPILNPVLQPGSQPRPKGYPQPGPEQRPEAYPHPGPQKRPDGYPQPGPQQRPDDYPQPGPQQRPDDYPQPGPQQRPDDYPQPGPQQRPDDYPQQRPDDYPKPGPQQRPDDYPQPGPQQRPDDYPHPGPQQRPDDFPQPGPQQRPDDYPQPGSQQRPDDYPQSRPQHRPDDYHQPGPQNRPDDYLQPGPQQKPEDYPQPGPQKRPDDYQQPGYQQKPEVFPQPGPQQGPGQYPQPGHQQGPEQYPQPGPQQGPEQYPQPGPQTGPEVYPPPGAEQKPEVYPQPGPDSYPQSTPLPYPDQEAYPQQPGSELYPQQEPVPHPSTEAYPQSGSTPYPSPETYPQPSPIPQQVPDFSQEQLPLPGPDKFPVAPTPVPSDPRPIPRPGKAYVKILTAGFSTGHNQDNYPHRPSGAGSHGFQAVNGQSHGSQHFQGNTNNFNQEENKKAFGGRSDTYPGNTGYNAGQSESNSLGSPGQKLNGGLNTPFRQNEQGSYQSHGSHHSSLSGTHDKTFDKGNFRPNCGTNGQGSSCHKDGTSQVSINGNLQGDHQNQANGFKVHHDGPGDFGSQGQDNAQGLSGTGNNFPGNSGHNTANGGFSQGSHGPSGHHSSNENNQQQQYGQKSNYNQQGSFSAQNQGSFRDQSQFQGGDKSREEYNNNQNVRGFFNQFKDDHKHHGTQDSSQTFGNRNFGFDSRRNDKSQPDTHSGLQHGQEKSKSGFQNVHIQVQTTHVQSAQNGKHNSNYQDSRYTTTSSPRGHEDFELDARSKNGPVRQEYQTSSHNSQQAFRGQQGGEDGFRKSFGSYSASVTGTANINGHPRQGQSLKPIGIFEVQVKTVSSHAVGEKGNAGFGLEADKPRGHGFSQNTGRFSGTGGNEGFKSYNGQSNSGGNDNGRLISGSGKSGQEQSGNFNDRQNFGNRNRNGGFGGISFQQKVNQGNQRTEGNSENTRDQSDGRYSEGRIEEQKVNKNTNGNYISNQNSSGQFAWRRYGSISQTQHTSR